MFKIKNIVVLFTVLTALGLSGDVWGMNGETETDNVNVVFGLKSTNDATCLYVLNSGDTSGAVEHKSLSVMKGTYTYYTKTLELDDTAGWTSIGEIMVNNRCECGIEITDYKTVLNNKQLSNKIDQGLKRLFFMDELMQFLVTEEADPIVIVRIEKEVQKNATGKAIFVLVKKARNPVLKARVPVQTDVVEFKTAKQFFPIDAEKKPMKNFYRYDHSAPEGFVWVKVATYFPSTECVKENKVLCSTISGSTFIEKIGVFVSNQSIATNIEKYEGKVEAKKEANNNNNNNNNNKIESSQKLESPNKKQPSKVATMISSSLSVLSGLFWGTIWAYCDMLPINKNYRTAVKIGLLGGGLLTARLCVDKNSKKADKAWVVGLALASMEGASCYGKQAVDATCTMVKNYFDKKVVKNINF